MSSKYVIDSYAWIEYFQGTLKGKTARQFIESGLAVTPTIVIAELSDKYNREGWVTFENDLGYVKTISEITQVDINIAVLAGEIKNKMRATEKNFSLNDGVILATAYTLGAKVVSGDPHFSKLAEAIKI